MGAGERVDVVERLREKLAAVAAEGNGGEVVELGVGAAHECSREGVLWLCRSVQRSSKTTQGSKGGRRRSIEIERQREATEYSCLFSVETFFTRHKRKQSDLCMHAFASHIYI